jgi:hypothetical protein
MLNKNEIEIVRNIIIKIGIGNLPTKLSLVYQFILELIRNDIIIDDCEYLSQLQPLYNYYFNLKIKSKKLCKKLDIVYLDSNFDDLTKMKHKIDILWCNIMNRYVVSICDCQLDSDDDSDDDYDDDSDDSIQYK